MVATQGYRQDVRKKGGLLDGVRLHTQCRTMCPPALRACALHVEMSHAQQASGTERCASKHSQKLHCTTSQHKDRPDAHSPVHMLSRQLTACCCMMQDPHLTLTNQSQQTPAALPPPPLLLPLRPPLPLPPLSPPLSHSHRPHCPPAAASVAAAGVATG